MPHRMAVPKRATAVCNVCYQACSEADTSENVAPVQQDTWAVQRVLLACSVGCEHQATH